GRHLMSQGFDPSCLQPLTGPFRQLPSRRSRQVREKIVELGVAPRMLLEVRANSVTKRGLSHPSDELAKNGSTLGIGDAVEVEAHRFGIDHIRSNGMGA